MSFLTNISCSSEYKNGTFPSTCTTSIFNSSGTILILYSLLYSKVTFSILINLVPLFNWSFKVQNMLNVSSFGFHNLQVASYVIFESSIILVSNVDFSSISDILNIFNSSK